MQSNMDNVTIFLRGKSCRQQAVELNDPLGKLNSPTGEVNTPMGELNPPTGEQNYGAGEVYSPAKKLNSPAGGANSPMGELNPLAGEQNCGAGEVDFYTGKLNRAGEGTQFPRDWIKIICAKFKTSPPPIIHPNRGVSHAFSHPLIAVNNCVRFLFLKIGKFIKA